MELTFIRAVIDCPYSRVMSIITKSQTDAIGIQLTDGSVMLFDAYTCRDIPGIDHRNDIWHSNIIKSIISETYILTEDSCRSTKRSMEDASYSIVDVISARRALGLGVYNNALVNGKSRVRSSKVSIDARNAESTSTTRFFDEILKELFNILPDLISSNTYLFETLFSSDSTTIHSDCCCDRMRDIIGVFPNVEEMESKEGNIDFLNTFTVKVRSLRSGISGVMESLADIKHINVGLLKDGLSTCCKTMGVPQSITFPEESTGSILVVDRKMKINVSQRIVEIPLYNADLNPVPTAVLKDIFTYLDSLPDHDERKKGDVLSRLVKEIASRDTTKK